jgi:hypothetical protein
MRSLRPFAKARLSAVMILCLSAQGATAARAGSSSTPVRSERQKLWAEEVREAIAKQPPHAAARTGSVAGARPARRAAQKVPGPASKDQGRGATGSDGPGGSN